MWIVLGLLLLLSLAVGFAVWRLGSYEIGQSISALPAAASIVEPNSAELQQANTQLQAARVALALCETELSDANALIARQKEAFLEGARKVQDSMLPMAEKMAELQATNDELTASLAKLQSAPSSDSGTLALTQQLDLQITALATANKELSDTKRLLGLAQVQAQSVRSARRALGDTPDDAEKPGWLTLSQAHDWVMREVRRVAQRQAMRQIRTTATRATASAAQATIATTAAGAPQRRPPTAARATGLAAIDRATGQTKDQSIKYRRSAKPLGTEPLRHRSKPIAKRVSVKKIKAKSKL